jgi:hypothetical protein
MGSTESLVEHKTYHDNKQLKAHWFTRDFESPRASPSFESKQYIHGKYIIYHENGTIESITHYNDNVMCGKQISYFSSGGVKHICYYDNNKLQGHYTKYHENGMINEKSYYINGVLFGQVLKYHDNGKFHRDEWFDHGIPYNYCKEYDKNGLLQLHQVYSSSENKQTGMTKHILSAGYINGELCFYELEIYKSFHCKVHYIYNVLKFDCVIKNIKVILPVMSFQRKFKRHVYSQILDTLNSIMINDLSLLILSYIKN